MSDKSRKYCAFFPCSSFAEPGSSHCREHQPARAPKETGHFYLSAAWRRFRDWYIRSHPLCEQCGREGRLTPAVMVDHIVELKGGGERLAEDNAQALCSACHNRKTASERSKRKNHQQSSRDNRAANKTAS